MSTGILLTNIGTPDHPTPAAVRNYLREFLSDRRIIEIPSVLWWPILHGFILRTRPRQSAKLYQKIWTEQGSPLAYLSQSLAEKLSAKLTIPVELGMHYGNPSIRTALENLRERNITQLLILPLYPQYSGTTTASAFDKITTVLRSFRTIPEIRSINHYAENASYISALCDTIKNSFEKNGRAEHLLFSFHGIPNYYAEQGDPYPILCKRTVELVAENLQLEKKSYSLTFQSRLGRTKWLMPYTDKQLKIFPEQGITDLQVICPGFAVDCLETLEEISIRGREQFLHAGGKKFSYIPALNDSAAHVNLLADLAMQHIQGWT